MRALRIAGSNVIDDSIAEHMVERIVGRNVRAAFADDDGIVSWGESSDLDRVLIAITIRVSVGDTHLGQTHFTA